MSALSGIKKPVENEMAEFEAYFSRTMRSEIPLLNIILNYILRRKGKQMRPLLVFLTARPVSYTHLTLPTKRIV